MNPATQIVLERTGDLVGRHPGDIALPVPSFDGRSVEPPAPPSVEEQAQEKPQEKSLEELQAELEQAKQDLADIIEARSKAKE